MANKNISIAEALQKVSKTAHEYINKNTPHIISEDVILTIPASSIVKADYETAKSNNEPYFVAITDTVTEVFNENNLYSVKYNGKEYDCVYDSGSYDVSTDTMMIGIRVIKDPNAPVSLDDEVSAQSVTVAPTPPYCYIGLIDTTNITDIQLISKKVQRLDNMFLKRDLEVVNSLTLGNRTGNIGEYSLASGNGVEASGSYSHAEGSDTIASDGATHAEGDGTKATKWGAHAEGCKSESSGYYSHAEGYFTKASSDHQHVQGKYNIEDTEGKYAHIVGNGAKDQTTNWKEVRSNAHTLDWKGNAWYAGDVQANNVPHVVSEKVVLTVPAATITAKKTEIDNLTNDSEPVRIPVDGTVTYDPTKLYYLKYNNKQYSVSTNEGKFMIVGDDCLCGIDTQNSATTLLIGKLDTTNITDMQLIEKDVKKLDNIYVPNDLRVSNSITVGARQGEIGLFSSTFGSLCEASGTYSEASGSDSIASGDVSHAEGYQTTASGDVSHAEGFNTIASAKSSHAEGQGTTASGDYSHAEGYETTASANASHAEGQATTASGECSHVEGYETTASGDNSHAEGYQTTASGFCSHAEGYETTALRDYSHAEGSGTKASSNNQHVQGRYNIEDTEGKYAHIVGNGFAAGRSNAHTLDWDGNGWYAGKLSQEGTPTEDKDLVTKKYFDENSTNVADGFVMNDQVNGHKYLIQMKDGVLTSILLPSSISVDTSSLQGVTFMEGDAIDLETLTFMANYPDGTSSKITDTENLSYSPSELTTDVTQISFIYNIAGLKLTYDMPVTVTAFDPAVKLQDFTYTTNNDGTYTLTGWKETHNGVASTELIIPNNKKIIL